jgi:hypothetical protein
MHAQRSITYLPSRVDAAGLGHEQARHRVVGVKADNQSRDAERAHTTRLGVLLLHAGNVLSNVLDRDGVLDSQTVGLALDARLVDKDTTVGSQTCKCDANVVVEHGDLADGAGVLQLKRRLLLNTKDDT